MMVNAFLPAGQRPVDLIDTRHPLEVSRQSGIANDQNVKWFYLASSPTTEHPGISKKYYNQTIVKAYGPFYNIGGGDASGGATYLIFYSATKK